MHNVRISKKERNLLKGAIRRVFARSELRKAVIEKSKCIYHNPSRPRVKTWCFCPSCNNYIPKSYMEVDHITPLIGLMESLEGLSWDEVINRLWCEERNLQAICSDCHKKKTHAENKLRRRYKKVKKGS